MIKTKVTKIFMEEQQNRKPSKVIQYNKSGVKPTIKSQRKPNMVKRTIDLDNSNDDTEVLNYDKPSIYDQALNSVNKTSPQKSKKMKILKTEKVT